MKVEIEFCVVFGRKKKQLSTHALSEGQSVVRSTVITMKGKGRGGRRPNWRGGEGEQEAIWRGKFQMGEVRTR